MRFELSPRRALARVPLIALVIVACAGDSSGRGGTLVISTGADADGFFPPAVTTGPGRQVSDLIFDRLAQIGPTRSTVSDEGWTPRLAERWEWSADSMAVTFHLDPRARWHDSVPVRVRDVLFAYRVYTDSVAGNSDGAQMRVTVDSLTEKDSLTFTVWFRQRMPERFFRVAYYLIPLPEHVIGSQPIASLRSSPFVSSPVGSGPYRLTRWDRKQRIELTATDNYYRGRPSLERLIWVVAQEGQTASQRVFSGAADFIERLTPPEVKGIAQYPGVRVLELRPVQLIQIVFNTRDGKSDRPHPVLGDRAVRRALTMAVDRAAIVKNIYDTLARVAAGPFLRSQWSADTTLQQIPFDPDGAARILDSLGWRAGANGMRSRGGRPLSITLLMPTSNQIAKTLVELVQAQWRTIGVMANIEPMDFQATMARAVAHEFDAIPVPVGADPSPAGLGQHWSTAAITMSNGLNRGRFSNATVDSLIQRAVVAKTTAEGRASYRAAYQALINEAPAIWVIEPRLFAAASTRLTTADLSRADTWWSTLAEWRVAAGSATPGEAAGQKQ